jgi:hypothetical protein
MHPPAHHAQLERAHDDISQRFAEFIGDRSGDRRSPPEYQVDGLRRLPTSDGDGSIL